MFYGWWIVVVAVLGQAIGIGASTYSYGLLVIPISSELGANRMEMMLGFTAGSVLSATYAPYLGSLVDRRSMRLLMAIGSCSLGLSLVLISRVTNVWEFIAAFAFFFPVYYNLLGSLGSNALVSRWFSRNLGKAISLTALGTSFGGLVVPYLFQNLIDAFGWRSACVWLGVGCVVLSLPPILWLIKDRPADIGLQPDGEQPLASTKVRTTIHAKPPTVVENLLAHGPFWRIAIAVGAMSAGYMAVVANLVPYALGHGVTSSAAAILVSIIAIAGITGKLCFSFIADHVNLKHVMIVAMALISSLLVALVLFDGYAVMVIASVALGLASGGLLPAWGALLARIYGPLCYGRVMGRMLPISIAMIIIATPLTGYLYDKTGSYSLAFSLLAGAIAIAAMNLAPLSLKPAE